MLNYQRVPELALHIHQKEDASMLMEYVGSSLQVRLQYMDGWNQGSVC